MAVPLDRKVVVVDERYLKEYLTEIPTVHQAKSACFSKGEHNRLQRGRKCTH